MAEGGNPFAPVMKGPSGRAPWPSDLLFERLSLLGFGIVDFEDLVSAFGDPDFDQEAESRYAVGDVELRSLVAAAKGEESEAHVPVGLPDDPMAVIGDNYGRDFEISWTIPALLAYVADDPRRAAWVLMAEKDQPRQRATLVSALTKIVEHG